MGLPFEGKGQSKQEHQGKWGREEKVTSIPKPGLSQPTILHPSISVSHPGFAGEAARCVHLCRDDLPAKPPSATLP